ncbi:M1 family metallopeptidase [Brevibacillus sp. SYP-B805]|uniref:M1 family metallopeptidase n=1 Tax=Brevibacillus sp. SYP-B805 TaxID=1578199 RepID=UPI0013ECB55F|nr:M1 family metallopeptidase [Brevibacillus sp. SYP-B805]NGQ96064.1 M1 family metallopeptidase [Brevibacillus sp. SYP-B805]
MKQWKRFLTVLFMAALGLAPFSSIPAAQAITKVTVSADDDTAGKETEYTVKFKLEEDFDKGDRMYITFDDAFTVDDLDTDDIEVNGDEPDKVTVDDNEIAIKVGTKYKDGDTLKVTIDGITNPKKAGSYKISVETDNDDDSDYATIKIKSKDDSGSHGTKNDAFDVTPTNPYEKDYSGYVIKKFDLDSKSDDLIEGESVVLTFPSGTTLPKNGTVNRKDVKINGYTAESVSVSGSKITVGIPEYADGDDYLQVEFFKDFGIQNPKAGTAYTITVEYDGYSYKSKAYEIKAPVTTNNFPVSLSNSKAGARSSYSFDVRFGTNEIKAGKQLKVEFPSASMIPSSLNRMYITINGKQVKSVKVSGKTVTLTASSSQSASKAVKVVFASNAKLTNPTAGSYQLKVTMDGKTLTSKSFSITK